jgi:hypothetical protein
MGQVASCRRRGSSIVEGERKRQDNGLFAKVAAWSFVCCCYTAGCSRAYMPKRHAWKVAVPFCVSQHVGCLQQATDVQLAVAVGH